MPAQAKDINANEETVRDSKLPSGGLAQLMVLANGLILTLAAYLVLGFYVSSVLQSDIERTEAVATDHVTQALEGMEQAVNTASILIAGDPQTVQNDPQKLRFQIHKALPNLSSFERFLFLSQNKPGKWRVSVLYEAPDGEYKPLMGLRGQAFISDVLEQTANFSNVGSVFLLSDDDQAHAYNLSIDPYVTARLVVVGRVLNEGNPEQGVILGITHTGRLVDQDWVNDKSRLARLVIRDVDKPLICLYMMSEQSASHFDCRIREDAAPIDMSFAGHRWQMDVQASSGDSGVVLAKVPLIVLVFGSLLTLLCTFYVRNNQRQAFRLAKTNKVLAQKNYDLNSEMSERERLHHTLRKMECEYKATINGISDIVFEISTEGEVLFLNETWHRITGYKSQQAEGSDFFDLLNPQDKDIEKAKFMELVRGQRQAYRAITKLRISDGSFRTVELAMSMIRQDEHKNLRVVGTITDIEDRRRAEHALSEAEKKYRTIWENAAGGIYQVTPEGQFLTANPSLASIFGYDDMEIMLRQVRNAHEQLYVSAKDRARFLRALETDGHIMNFETQAVTRQGRTIWVNESARAVKNDSGDILYFEGSIEDITHRKEAEIQLRDAKIQSDLANRAKSEFLANMSHELRTPLNAIIGFSEIIKNEVLGPVQPKEYKEYSGDIYDSGKRLLKIINEILDVSRIETGERNLNEEMIHLDKLAHSCIDFVRPKADAKDIKITSLIDTNAPHIIGEEVAIKQIVLNLLSNAVKFTPESGRITVSYEMDRDEQLRFSISDTGIGIDDSEIEKALSPFGQVDTAFNRNASGAGLGLTLVNSLIKLHGGSLELFSQKGLGTTATVIFPAKRLQFEAPGNQQDGEGQRDGGANGSAGSKGFSSHKDDDDGKATQDSLQ